MRKTRLLFLLWLVGIIVWSAVSQGQTPEEFSDRRKALRNQLSRRGVVVLKAAEPVTDFYGADYRQESNFYYLTGFSRPNAALFISRRGLRVPGDSRLAKEILLFREQRAPSSVDGEPALTCKQVADELLFDAALPIERFYDLFANVLVRADTLYFRSKRLGLDEPLTKELELIEAARKRQYQVEVVDPTPLLAKMRVKKSPGEIGLLRKAIDITCDAQIEAMKSVEPGMYEYELGALVEYVFKRQGAERVGFRSIVGSGPNSCIIHYDANLRQTQAKELVVLDIGAEYRHYSADITRTFPVSGTFTERQRAIYDLVLKAQQAAIDIIRPGLPFQEIHEKAAEVIGQGLVDLGLISDPSEHRKYFFHGTSHYIGLDVHDPGPHEVLEAGMILTVEPGIYIQEESLGVRIEDDVLVTDEGHEVISIGAPKSAVEIEAIMKQEGIGNIK